MDIYAICEIGENETKKNIRCAVCNIDKSVDKRWNFLNGEFQKDYFSMILKKLHSPKIIYPPFEMVFAFTEYHSPENTKVIILGQDPYHNPNQANGLAFSVNLGCSVPRSLQNIYKEVKNCYPTFSIPNHGCLNNWARQGVLLLNTVLTVTHKSPDSHSKYGWEIFTRKILAYFNKNYKNIVYIGWGKKAQLQIKQVDKKTNLVLEGPHPSPFSARTGFFGCNHFKLANNYLVQHNKLPVDWTDL